MKERIIEKKTGELKEYAQQISELVHSYVPPKPQKMQQAFQQGSGSLSRAGADMLDEDWARFLRAHNFLVGLSIDGPKNGMIRTPSGEPGLNYLCSGLRKFWDHINPYRKEIIARVQKEGAPCLA